MKTVTIENISYPVHFGLSTIKNFAIINGMETIDEFEKFMTGLDQGSLKSMELISELLKYGLERGCEKAGIEFNLSSDDILDLATDDPATFAALTSILGESFRSGKETKPAAPKKKVKRLPGTK